MMAEKTDQHANIETFIKKFLDFLDVEGEVTLVPVHEKRVEVKIMIADGQQGYLIGKQGSSLAALQHLVSLLARKEGVDTQYRLDSNDYQQGRDQLFLKKVADYVAEKEESVELLLWPMTPYERRLVHEYFLNAGTHTTESEDFGSRRVVRVIKK